MYIHKQIPSGFAVMHYWCFNKFFPRDNRTNRVEFHPDYEDEDSVLLHKFHQFQKYINE